MLGEYLEVGDQVVITIPNKNRKWGYNPCPDGTIGTFLSFGEIAYGRIHNFGRNPGFHDNHCWCNIMTDGKEINISASYLEFADPHLNEIRTNKYGKTYLERKRCETFRRDLPELPLWEWDEVEYFRSGNWRPSSIEMIDYSDINRTCTDGSQYPFYQVSSTKKGGGITYAAPNDLRLIQRGLVWKWYHKEPIVFTSLEEEVKLHHALSLYDEVRNPKDNLYRWTLEELLQAIKDGLGHGFSVGTIPFTDKISHSLKKFHDEDLGKRVAQATLAGFHQI